MSNVNFNKDNKDNKVSKSGGSSNQSTGDFDGRVVTNEIKEENLPKRTGSKPENNIKKKRTFPEFDIDGSAEENPKEVKKPKTSSDSMTVDNKNKNEFLADLVSSLKEVKVDQYNNLKSFYDNTRQPKWSWSNTSGFLEKLNNLKTEGKIDFTKDTLTLLQSLANQDKDKATFWHSAFNVFDILKFFHEELGDEFKQYIPQILDVWGDFCPDMGTAYHCFAKQGLLLQILNFLHDDIQFDLQERMPSIVDSWLLGGYTVFDFVFQTEEMMMNLLNFLKKKLGVHLSDYLLKLLNSMSSQKDDDENNGWLGLWDNANGEEVMNIVFSLLKFLKENLTSQLDESISRILKDWRCKGERGTVISSFSEDGNWDTVVDFFNNEFSRDISYYLSNTDDDSSNTDDDLSGADDVERAAIVACFKEKLRLDFNDKETSKRVLIFLKSKLLLLSSTCDDVVSLIEDLVKDRFGLDLDDETVRNKIFDFVKKELLLDDKIAECKFEDFVNDIFDWYKDSDTLKNRLDKSYKALMASLNIKNFNPDLTIEEENSDDEKLGDQ